jgi:hypothetical protein
MNKILNFVDSDLGAVAIAALVPITVILFAAMMDTKNRNELMLAKK